MTLRERVCSSIQPFAAAEIRVFKQFGASSAQVEIAEEPEDPVLREQLYDSDVEVPCRLIRLNNGTYLASHTSETLSNPFAVYSGLGDLYDAHPNVAFGHHPDLPTWREDGEPL